MIPLFIIRAGDSLSDVLLRKRLDELSRVVLSQCIRNPHTTYARNGHEIGGAICLLGIFNEKWLLSVPCRFRNMLPLACSGTTPQLVSLLTTRTRVCRLRLGQMPETQCADCVHHTRFGHWKMMLRFRLLRSHAAAAVKSVERDRLEKLVRYMARPAIAANCLANGCYGEINFTRKKSEPRCGNFHYTAEYNSVELGRAQ